MRPIKPYLQLVRLPNLFTAAADPLAGWLIAGRSLGEAGGWAPLVAASVAIYAAGMTLNDAFDVEVDRVERPARPLPSGRVGLRFAATLGASLLLLGPALAAFGGRSSLVVGLALAASVLAYDAGLKRTPIGPGSMGACRALNLLLGLSGAADLGGPIGWLAAASFGLFVAGITRISRDEARPGPGRRGGLVAGLAIQDLALIGLVASAVGLARPAWPGLLAGLSVFALIGFVVNRVGLLALREPTPARLQLAVKAGVLGLVWLDVGLVASSRGPAPALAVAALWIPAFLLGRWIYST